ncbi:transmembrane protein 140 [Terrapene carolina triunguis]|uniref:transmembrane protein 140 n=1 Tax=Terrapene triunguis TaxID=2587831 RepID=UPI000E77F286|nr:transmembrane protein 140 [Terrapene carolina triunguis]XP_026504654.1 transmembrane protein 140 [Terrapene carolina triunguis]XP_026504655.1 transmembrane protein 140 [Terrapene carolina triunguis]XP_026504656.1 transmembrane protein 140 [Terrapene carolina triunguis]XP_026504657.1 transmembrane protein 140 [Terrapene carolina triunguis]XP_026504658.1 transmembrane protein 140 [Terrapene carolina triunguis]XP_026504659.1 transmembrane protein 140 [Terrapene carolina triunguis]
MGLLKQRTGACQLYWSMLLLAAGSFFLLLYALMWEAGNIINLPHKRIGFYNFCLWNQTSGELQCLEFKDLMDMGVDQFELVLARFCVYTVQVLCSFSPFLIMQAQYANTREAWEVTLVVLGLSAALLAGGLGLFLFQAWVCIQLSELSGGFMALAGAQALLLLQLFAAAMYLTRFKEVLEKGNPSPEEQPPAFQV